MEEGDRGWDSGSDEANEQGEKMDSERDEETEEGMEDPTAEVTCTSSNKRKGRKRMQGQPPHTGAGGDEETLIGLPDLSDQKTQIVLAYCK